MARLPSSTNGAGEILHLDGKVSDKHHHFIVRYEVVANNKWQLFATYKEGDDVVHEVWSDPKITQNHANDWYFIAISLNMKDSIVLYVKGIHASTMSTWSYKDRGVSENQKWTPHSASRILRAMTGINVMGACALSLLNFVSTLDRCVKEHFRTRGVGHDSVCTMRALARPLARRVMRVGKYIQR